MGTVYLGKANPMGSGGGGGSITVDQTYDATSANAQSGTAVAEAIATVPTYSAGTNVTISNGTISATDTTYSAFTGATSQAAGAAGLVPAPTTTDVDKYLKGDGTWGTVSGGGIQNTALGTDCLTILGTPIAAGVFGSINIGPGTSAGGNSVAIGSYDNSSAPDVGVGSVGIGCDIGTVGDNSVAINGSANGSHSVAINGDASSYDGCTAINGNCSNSNQIVIGQGNSNSGGYGLITLGSNYIESGFHNCIIGHDNDVDGYSNTIIGRGWIVKANSCILLGPVDGYEETLTENKVFYVSFQTATGDPGTFVRYKMLDGSTGKIPNDRINGVSGSFTTNDGKNVTVTNGVITSIV